MLSIRAVEDEECQMLWEWVNDPNVRASAFDSHPISWEEHVAWFRAKRTDSHCAMYVVLDEQQHPVGQVRFERHADGSAETSISIAKERRQRGYGTEAVRLACAVYRQAAGQVPILAYIKPENLASVRMFETAGFASCGRAQVRGHEAVFMRLDIHQQDGARP